ncbi:hypothetical protein C8R46DRAFT_1353774 [Mycena filopes]|nr:hypothetical protein C8R46DRAFT_1353774 [Mycena filopes]
MSDAVVATFILWIISPVIGNTLRYIILAFLLALFFLFAAYCQTPSHKLVILRCAIKLTEDTLVRALVECLRDHRNLQLLSESLMQAKIGLETWKEYVQAVWGVLRSISECAKKVEQIRVSVLRIVEAEHKYKLQRASEETRAIIHGNDFRAAEGPVQEDGLRRRAVAAPDVLPVFFKSPILSPSATV